jgi:hypothetical protein
MLVRAACFLVCGAVLAACTSESPSTPAAPSIATPLDQTIHTGNPCDHDSTGPTISGVSASPSSLWPPNHKMRRVAVTYNPSDPCGPVTCSLGVASNEPVDSIGDGHTAPDWVVTGTRDVQLRAERQGPRSGRIYTVTISCRDSRQNLSMAKVTVTVPHDQGR